MTMKKRIKKYILHDLAEEIEISSALDAKIKRK
jgi:hypothetical protein